MSEGLKEITVLLHSIVGFSVGVIGLLQILMKKGGKLHRFLGLAYVVCWVMVAITGAMIGHIIVTFIGVLGLYMCITGYRFAHVKSIPIQLFDKVLFWLGFGLSLATITGSIVLMVLGKTTFGTIAGFFGLIFLITTIQDIQRFVFLKPKGSLGGHRMQWFFEHFTRMYISYIAAMTAFAAIQNVTGVVLINWIAPTFVGTALIILSSRKYRKKFKIQ